MHRKVIKDLMHFKVVIHSTKGTNSLGDPIDSTFTCLGYFMESNILVVTHNGREENSSAQVYLKGEDVERIKPDDRIDVFRRSSTVMEDGQVTKWIPVVQDKIIQKREAYYKPKGIPDVGVLYLP